MLLKENVVKTKLGKLPYIYPIPITLVGANVDGKPNFETIGDVGLMGINPALVYIASHRDHYTNLGILANGTYSINFPNTAMLAQADYCGGVSGRDADPQGANPCKAELFEVFYGELETAPMIVACPVSLECRVIQEFSIQKRQIFIAEVVQTYADAQYVIEDGNTRGLVDLTQLDPILYALDNRYYSIGKPIGVGYQEAKRVKN
jgi:flavin reductase (DIM6/NTAB) family NADH-FMN oxidoreductase RutF